MNGYGVVIATLDNAEEALGVVGSVTLCKLLGKERIVKAGSIRTLGKGYVVERDGGDIDKRVELSVAENELRVVLVVVLKSNDSTLGRLDALHIIGKGLVKCGDNDNRAGLDSLTGKALDRLLTLSSLGSRSINARCGLPLVACGKRYYGIFLDRLANDALDGLLSVGSTGRKRVYGSVSLPDVAAGCGNGLGLNVAANGTGLSYRACLSTGSRGGRALVVRVTGSRNSGLAACLLLATSGTLDGSNSFLCASSCRVNSCLGSPCMLTIATAAARGKCYHRYGKTKDESKS